MKKRRTGKREDHVGRKKRIMRKPEGKSGKATKKRKRSEERKQQRRKRNYAIVLWEKGGVKTQPGAFLENRKIQSQIGLLTSTLTKAQ